MRTVPVAVAFTVLALAVAGLGIAQLIPAARGEVQATTPRETPTATWSDGPSASRPRSEAARVAADSKTHTEPLKPGHKTRPG